MKVLHVIPGIAPRYGGPSPAVLQMCRALRRQGVETSLATTDADGPGRLAVPYGVETDYEGVPAVFFPRRLGEGFKLSVGLARWLSGAVAQFDVVHIHALFSHSSLAAARACRRHGVPSVVCPHGMLDPWALGQKRLRKRILMWAAVRQMIARAAAVHFTTDQERALAEQTVGITRGVVLPFGVDDALLDTQPAASAERQSYILALARLHPVKNLEALIDAFSNLVQQDGRFSPWRLIIAGDGDPAYRARLQARAARHELANPVEFPGWVEGEAKADLLRRAALFVQPSFQESFGISLVEALAYGVPAVVTKQVNLAGDVARAGAGWVTDCDIAALTSTLREALASPGERAKRSTAAATLAQRFRWSSIARSLGAVYANAASLAHVAAAPTGLPRAPGFTL